MNKASIAVRTGPSFSRVYTQRPRFFSEATAPQEETSMGGPFARGPSPGFQRVYIGNLPWRANEGDIRGLFERFGEVKTIRLVVDRETQRSKGFAFVDIPESAVQVAIKELNSSSFQGRQIIVSEARTRDPNAPRPPRQGDRAPRRPFDSSMSSEKLD